MTASWILYMGLSVGLSYREAMFLPVSRVLALKNIDLIASGTATRAKSQREEENDFWDALSRK